MVVLKRDYRWDMWCVLVVSIGDDVFDECVRWLWLEGVV